MKSHLITNEAGGAITIILLILLPMLIVTGVYFNEDKRLRTGADTTLKNAVVFASKAASQTVDAESQADGDPMIDPEAAHLNFKKVLIKDLKLNESMQALPGSPVSGTVSYRLLICNGVNRFNLPQGVLYIYENGNLRSVQLSIGNLPQAFDISLTSEELTNGRTVTLDCPGSIAVINAVIKSVAVASEIPTARWACTKIIAPNRVKRDEMR